MKTLNLQKVSYTYQTKYQKVQAVKDATYTFESGRLYAITGESGSGKSTLLSLLAGLDLPTEGDILVDGQSIKSINRDVYRQKEASVVYQSYHLLPLLTAIENVTLPMELNGVSRSERRKFGEQFLRKVGLSGELHNKLPKMMSGGEQQRVAIARAMAAGGNILLADEPTGNLDTDNEQKIVNLLLQLAHNEGYLVIVVTHNPLVAKQADMVCKMKDGVLIRQP